MERALEAIPRAIEGFLYIYFFILWSFMIGGLRGVEYHLNL